MITIGADPEVFLVDKEGVHRSSIGKIGGSKQEPLPMKGLSPGFAVQEDNVAAEFNIPPATNGFTFNNNIARGLKYVEKLAKKHNLAVDILPAVHFDPKEFYHPAALELGCDPDFNAWTGGPNPRPVPPETLRTAAGHIHIGYPDPNRINQLFLVKLLDLYLSVPMVLAYPHSERRTLYGKAGAFRPTPYGLEYRTPDNYWLRTKEDRLWVFHTTKACVERMIHSQVKTKNGYSFGLLEEEINNFKSVLISCINDGNRDIAANLMHIFGMTTVGTPPPTPQKQKAKPKVTFDDWLANPFRVGQVQIADDIPEMPPMPAEDDNYR